MIASGLLRVTHACMSCGYTQGISQTRGGDFSKSDFTDGKKKQRRNDLSEDKNERMQKCGSPTQTSGSHFNSPVPQKYFSFQLLDKCHFKLLEQDQKRRMLTSGSRKIL